MAGSLHPSRHWAAGGYSATVSHDTLSSPNKETMPGGREAFYGQQTSTTIHQQHLQHFPSTSLISLPFSCPVTSQCPPPSSLGSSLLVNGGRSKHSPPPPAWFGVLCEREIPRKPPASFPDISGPGGGGVHPPCSEPRRQSSRWRLPG